MIDLHKPVVITDGGPWAEHDYACPVCQTNNAILDLNDGVFLPCNKCSGKGWRVAKLPKFLAQYF